MTYFSPSVSLHCLKLTDVLFFSVFVCLVNYFCLLFSHCFSTSHLHMSLHKQTATTPHQPWVLDNLTPSSPLQYKAVLVLPALGFQSDTHDQSWVPRASMEAFKPNPDLFSGHEIFSVCKYLRTYTGWLFVTQKWVTLNNLNYCLIISNNYCLLAIIISYYYCLLIVIIIA